MTEADWLHGDDPRAMIQWYKGSMSHRKFRLFIGACCRTLWDELTPTAAREAINVLERTADGLADRQQLEDARTILEAEVAQLWELIEGSSGGWADSLYMQARALGCATRAAFYARIDPQFWTGCCDIGTAHQCLLLRDIFGTPHRRITIDPDWLVQADALAPALARLTYEERSFENLPVLADALEESGCPEQAILSHLRGGGPHVRGCWALDALLGKS